MTANADAHAYANRTGDTGSPSRRRVVVVAGGGAAPLPGLAERITPAEVVIAADSGLHVVEALGLQATLVVGDFDSVEQGDLDRAVAYGATLERHPVAKDQTDLELAIDRAVEVGGAGAEVTVVASIGGRLDHALANLLVLTAPAYADCVLDAYIDRWAVGVVQDGSRDFAAKPGQTVTILVIEPTSARITTRGLEYPLCNDVVYRSSTRGVSNVALGDRFGVEVDGGVALVLREWAD